MDPGHPIRGGLERHLPVSQRFLVPQGDRCGVHALAGSSSLALKLGGGEPCRCGQHRGFELGVQLVGQGARVGDNDFRVTVGELPRAQAGQRGRQLLCQHACLFEQVLRGAVRDPQRGRDFGHRGALSSRGLRPRPHAVRGRHRCIQLGVFEDLVHLLDAVPGRAGIHALHLYQAIHQAPETLI